MNIIKFKIWTVLLGITTFLFVSFTGFTVHADSIMPSEGNQSYSYNPVYKNNENAIHVYLNNQELTFESDPEIKNNRTFVPMRQIFETLNAKVTWNQDRKEIIVNRGFDEINLKIGSSIAFLNDEIISLDANPYIKDNCTFIPLRFVSESLNCNVQWDQATKSVYICSNAFLDTRNDSELNESINSISGTNAAISILGKKANLTYNDALKQAISIDASCIEARLNLKKAEYQSEEFNTLYSRNYTIAIMQNRKDLQLLKNWQEKNVIVTEEQTAFKTRCNMDAISIKLVEIKNQENVISHAQKCYETMKKKYELGVASSKELSSSKAIISTEENKLDQINTELDALYITLYGDIGFTSDEHPCIEFILDYQPIGAVNIQEKYEIDLANDPYIWYVENAADNADFDLKTYEYNVGGQSWTMTKMDLQAAKNNENAVKKLLYTTLETRYNQIVQIENNIAFLESQKEQLLESIDTMRTLYENGLKSRTDLEDVLQNAKTISYNILKLKNQHVQLKAMFEKPYLNPTYMSIS